MADNLTPDQRRRAMQAVKRSNTNPELALRRALLRAGIRGYRLDRNDLPGRPDICFRKAMVAVFVDGGFWHGHPDRFPRPGLSEYWLTKIRRNIDRDRAVNRELESLGWTALRIWDFEVKREPERCVERIVAAMGAGVYDGRPDDRVNDVRQASTRRRRSGISI